MRFTKILRFIDLLVQTILIGGILVACAKVLFENGAHAWETMIFFAMIGAMFLGPWQLLSSIITTAARAQHFKLRVVHLVTAILYLAIILVTDGFRWLDSNPLNSMLSPVFVVGTPTALALFYYYITMKTL